MLNNKKAILISILFIISFVIIVYIPAINNGFVNMDDPQYILQNNMIQDLSIGNIKKMFTTIYYGNYFPLTLLSFALDYSISKTDPKLYHINNIILHILNTLLVFWFIMKFSKNVLVSFITSLLFGIHPLHVQSVAWIAERKDVLYAFFYILGLIIYLYYLDNNKIKYYFLVLFLFFLSLLSKSMAITFPLILLVLDYFYIRKLNLNSLVAKLPFFILTAVFSILTILSQKEAIIHNKNILLNLLNLSYSFSYYVFKLVLPVKLSYLYPYPDITMYAIFVISSFLLFIGTIYSLKYTKNILFGCIFFILVYLPVSGIVSTVAGLSSDRYIYVSSIGFFYVFSIMGNQLNKYSRKIKYSAFFVMLCYVFLLGSLTFQNCKIWNNSIKLWENVANLYPNPVVAAIAYNNIGLEYSSIGKTKQAINYFNKSIDTKKDYAEAYVNRGGAYFKDFKYNEAIDDCTTALKYKNNFAQAYYNRSLAYSKIGKKDKALKDLEKTQFLSEKGIR